MSQETLSIPQPILAEGEILIASLITKNERYHLVLLPGENEPATHQDQLDWAASIGGDLPNRAEAALLYREAKEQFKPRAYWTNEIDASDSDYAWYQYFDDGYQDYYGTLSELRARAVRRLPI